MDVDIYNQLNGTYLGTLGLVTGADDWGVTYNIGIETTSGSRSIILQSARNIALRADGAGIWITASRIVWNGADLEDIIHDIAYEVASELVASSGGGTT